MIGTGTYLICTYAIGTGSVADPYHFDTDPDPGCEKIRYRSESGSRVNFDTDPDPGKNYTDPDSGTATLGTGTGTISFT